jgi:hypothetical protein
MPSPQRPDPGAARDAVDALGRALLSLSLALAALATCAREERLADQIAQQLARSDMVAASVVAYTRVPREIAASCGELISQSGWRIVSVGPAYAYGGSSHVEYALLGADGPPVSAQCSHHHDTRRTRLEVRPASAGPVIEYVEVPLTVALACEAEIARLGWHITRVGRVFGYRSDTVVDYRLRGRGGESAPARCFHDGRSRRARIQL